MGVPLNPDGERFRTLVDSLLEGEDTWVTDICNFIADMIDTENTENLKLRSIRTIEFVLGHKKREIQSSLNSSEV
jgi:hypothetical protein